MRPFQEEKLALALFHHHLLADFWAETLSGRALKLLRTLIPPSWVMDPAPLPPGAVLDAPRAAGRALSDWRDLANATQKERDLIIKISGYHETAWAPAAWSSAATVPAKNGNTASTKRSPSRRRICTFSKPSKTPPRPPPRLPPHRPDVSGVTPPRDSSAPTMTPVEVDGRLRLCPYYFVVDGKPRLSGALATFCPPDKKIIHGMQDAALLPCRVV